MKAIVTGGAGFIGSHLVDALVERGDKVLVIDNLSPLAGGRRENINSRSLFLEADIRNDISLINDFKSKKTLRDFKQVDYIFHCAALPRVQLSWKKPKITHNVNVLGTMNIITLAVLLNAKRMVHSSSSSIYGNQATLPLKEDMFANPLSPYGLQKFDAEKYCQFLCQPEQINRLNGAVCLRYFNVYGPRQSDDSPYSTVISRFLKARKDCVDAVIYGDGEQRRDFTHVSDVIRANILAAESPNVGMGEVINIGAGKNHSVNQIFMIIGGSRRYEAPRSGEPRETLADIRKARGLLGWEPQISLEQGIAGLLKLHKLV